MSTSASTPPQKPALFTHTAESIAHETKQICQKTLALLDKLVANVSPKDATFESVMVPLVENEDERRLVFGLLSSYRKFSPDSALRDASETAESKAKHFMLDFWAREDVFRLVDAVFTSLKPADTDAESRKLLSEWRRMYVHNGILLETDEQKRRFKEIKKRMSTIELEMQKNMDEEQEPVQWFTFEQLAGVPEARLQALEAGTGENQGKLKVVGSVSLIKEIQKFIHDPATREELSKLSRNKALGNVALFEEGVLLRREAAQLLGYDNHADFKLNTKMAKNSQVVLEFLEDIRERAIPHRDNTVRELFRLKSNDHATRGLPVDNELHAWDAAYYLRMQEERAFAVDQVKISEYLPVDATVDAMLDLFGELFGFIFTKLDKKALTRLSSTGKATDLVWHEDVMIFSVWDREAPDAFIGYLYLDLLDRPGKYPGLQCYPIQLGYTRPDGKRQYPSTLLLTNFLAPGPGQPTLLRHQDAVMLFHELGHGMHDLAGRSRYSRFHGAETVGDFNEAPSQMLENWFWTRPGLQRLTAHHETGEPLPDELIDALVASKQEMGVIILMAQLRMALFDMEVHAVGGDGPIDIAAIFERHRYLAGTGDAEDKHPWSVYRFLFQGMDAGLYSYLWSKAHAQDMFETAFRRDPLNSEAGRRYRHMVLEKGATQDEMETLRAFLGRDPKPDALLEDLGLC